MKTTTKKETWKGMDTKRHNQVLDFFAPTWTIILTFFAINALDILRAILTQNDVAAAVNVLDYVLLPLTKIIFVVIKPTFASLTLLSLTVFVDLVTKYALAAVLVWIGKRLRK